jgi:hypothetical protein
MDEEAEWDEDADEDEEEKSGDKDEDEDWLSEDDEKPKKKKMQKKVEEKKKAKPACKPKKVRQVFHPPSDHAIFNDPARTRPAFRPVENKSGGTKTFHMEGLNIHCPDRCDDDPDEQDGHWGVTQTLRELFANAIDAMIQGLPENVDRHPDIAMVHNLYDDASPVGGRLLLNGAMAVSYTVKVDRVVSSDKYSAQEWERKDSGRIPIDYIECARPLSESDERTSRYRVSLYIKNSGAAIPLSAWVMAHSSKGREANSIKSDCVIGGFGFGMKDACLALRKHGFGSFYLFVNDPLGRRQECSFYRAQLDKRHENSHCVPTLEMKFSFSKDAPKDKNENLPIVVSDFSRPPAKQRAKAGNQGERALGLVGSGGVGEQAGSVGVSPANRDIAHTIVQVASIVRTKEAAIERVQTLFASLRQHAICTANPFLQMEAGEFVRRELAGKGEPGLDGSVASSSPSTSLPATSASASASSSSPSTSASTSASASASPSASLSAPSVSAPSMEVTIEHNGGPRFGMENMLAVVSLQARSSKTIQICTWPGLLMVMLEGQKQPEGVPNRIHVKAAGAQFGVFTFRFCKSYKRSQNRDRTNPYSHKLSHFCGSAIITACEEERAASLPHCASVWRALRAAESPADVLAKLREAVEVPDETETEDTVEGIADASPRLLLPFNVALVELLLEAVRSGKKRENPVYSYNIDMLLSNSKAAQPYIQTHLFAAFTPITYEDGRVSSICKHAYAARLKMSAQQMRLLPQQSLPRAPPGTRTTACGLITTERTEGTERTERTEGMARMARATVTATMKPPLSSPCPSSCPAPCC